jgi:hypothetical protein
MKELVVFGRFVGVLVQFPLRSFLRQAGMRVAMRWPHHANTQATQNGAVQAHCGSIPLCLWTRTATGSTPPSPLMETHGALTWTSLAHDVLEMPRASKMVLGGALEMLESRASGLLAVVSRPVVRSSLSHPECALALFPVPIDALQYCCRTIL